MEQCCRKRTSHCRKIVPFKIGDLFCCNLCWRQENGAGCFIIILNIWYFPIKVFCTLPCSLFNIWNSNKASSLPPTWNWILFLLWCFRLMLQMLLRYSVNKYFPKHFQHGVFCLLRGFIFKERKNCPRTQNCWRKFRKGENVFRKVLSLSLFEGFSPSLNKLLSAWTKY